MAVANTAANPAVNRILILDLIMLLVVNGDSEIGPPAERNRDRRDLSRKFGPGRTMPEPVPPTRDVQQLTRRWQYQNRRQAPLISGDLAVASHGAVGCCLGVVDTLGMGARMHPRGVGGHAEDALHQRRHRPQPIAHRPDPLWELFLAVHMHRRQPGNLLFTPGAPGPLTHCGPQASANS